MSYPKYMTDREALNSIAERVHQANKKWWINIETHENIERNIGEMLMLVVSELSEALEGHRKDLQDDKLPHRRMFDVEIADTLIRLFDIAGTMIPELGEIFEEKMEFNSTRHDHSIEGRKQPGGKRY